MVLSELGADEVNLPRGKYSLVVTSERFTPGEDTTGSNAAAGTGDAKKAWSTAQSREEPIMVADVVVAAAG